MKNRLLLHDQTAKQSALVVADPPHALILVGGQGSGKLTLGRRLAADLLQIDADKLDISRGFKFVELPDGKSEVPIDAIREVIRSLGLKDGSRRVVLIDQADKLSEEAQNALLKVIEEPPEDTVFILNTKSVSGLLPTIVSRSQRMIIRPAGLNDSIRYFSSESAEADIKSAWSLSRGAPGLLSALLTDSSDHPMKQAVEQAKSFLKMDSYQRLVYLDGLSSDKEALMDFLDGLNRVLAAITDASAIRQSRAQVARLVTARKIINRSIEQLQTNVSPRLICTNLALRLNL
ncbi:AAA family ATPase [Candidatus Saccharibacteria bacterium]|nr:AAA family ATPase [Candidatus Saccharibacteria bacterium]